MRLAPAGIYRMYFSFIFLLVVVRVIATVSVSVFVCRFVTFEVSFLHLFPSQLCVSIGYTLWVPEVNNAIFVLGFSNIAEIYCSLRDRWLI